MVHYFACLQLKSILTCTLSKLFTHEQFSLRHENIQYCHMYHLHKRVFVGMCRWMCNVCDMCVYVCECFYVKCVYVFVCPVCVICVCAFGCSSAQYCLYLCSQMHFYLWVSLIHVTKKCKRLQKCHKWSFSFFSFVFCFSPLSNVESITKLHDEKIQFQESYFDQSFFHWTFRKLKYWTTAPYHTLRLKKTARWGPNHQRAAELL